MFSADEKTKEALELPVALHFTRRIFLSYGRDEYADEARALRDALLARGHEVWFDEQRLGSGLDWEHSIEKGLGWCDRVVLLMTPHSVRRPDGFCLNEIAKAMELRRTIIPVLLVEVPLGAPTSICRIQYLDWRDAVPAAERVERFERHLGRLCEAIEEDKLDFEGGQQRLQQLLQPIDFDSDIRPHVARFQGRQQLLARLRGWMQSPAGQQLLWLSAAPGLGKTAVAAQLAHRWPEVVAMHFCVAGHQDKADPARAILSIAYQLSTKLETFRVRLDALDLEREVQKGDAKTLFDNLLARPLSGAMQHPVHPCVVLVDGLDEATDANGRNRLAEVLGEGWGRLPAWLRLLVSSRPEMEISQSLAESAENLQLDADDAEQQADIAQFLSEQLSAIGKPPSPETLRRIVERSEGAFIYAVRLVEEVNDGRCDPDNPSDLPAGMNQFYLQTFRRRFPNRQSYNAECAPLLSLLLAAPEPVPLAVLANATGTEPWEVRLRLQQLGSMLDIKPGADTNRDELDTVRFSHASLRSWLTKLDKRTRAPAAGHFTLRPDTAALAKTVLARWDAQTAEGADGPEGFVARSLWTLLQTSKDAAAMDRIALDYSLYWENLRLIRALEPAEHAAKVGSQRASAQGATPEILEGAARSSRHLGDVLTALGRSAEALAQYSQSREFAEHLAAQDPDNAEWQRELSGSYSRIGRVLLSQGNLAGALEQFRKSHETAEHLAAQDPDNAEWQRELSISYNRIGGVLESQGNLAGALEQFRKSHETAEHLAAQDPDNAGWQQDLSISYNRIGGVLESQGNLAGALEQFQKDLVIAERLATQDPDNAGWQQDLSVSYNRIGGVLESQGNLAGALELFQKRLQISERLATQDPDNAGWQRDLSGSYSWIGGVLESQGNLAGALELFQKRLQISERLATQDPDNAGWQRDLSISYNRIGGVLESQGNLAGALELFQKRLQISERLATQDPDNAGWQRDLSISYNRIGGILESQGNLAGALEQFRKSHETAEHLAAQDPDNAGWQQDLSISYNRIGGVLESQGNLAGALEQFQKDLVIAERLATQDPDNAGWQQDLSVSYNRIGGVLESQGNLAGALEQFQKDLVIAERLATQDPDNAGWQQDLSVSYNRIGGILESQGNLAGALELFQKRLQISERLATQDPDNAGWQQDLSVSYNRIGGVLESQGNLAGALELFQKRLQISERLATQDPDNAGWQRDLSISYNRIGGILESQGNLAGALELFQKRLQISERLATQDPDNAGWQRDLSISYNRIGGILESQGNLAGALEQFQKDLVISERLATQDPDNAGWQRDLSISYNRIGGILESQGNLAGALAIYQRELAVDEGLARRFPESAELQGNFAHTRQAWGVRLREAGRLDEARDVLTLNLEFKKSVFGAERVEVASGLSALGQTEVLAGNVETGIQWLEKSRAITLEIEPLDENNLRNIEERLSHARSLLKH